MKKLLYTTLIFTLLTVCSTSLNAEVGIDAFINEELSERDENNPGNLMTIDVYINSSTTIRLENVSTKNTLDVYSILGVKVTSRQLKNYTTNYNIELPKGIYILKSGKVTKKIVVR